MRQINILLITPTRTDATAFYRLGGVFGELRQRYNINVYQDTKGNMVDWPDVEMMDVIYMQRPNHQKYVDFVQMCKHMNKPVILDYDDNHFSIPIESYTHALLNTDEAQNIIKNICNLADLVICSTNYLRNEFQKRTKTNCVVVNNGVPDFFFKLATPKPLQDIMMWRGNTNKESDLYLAREALLRLIPKYPNYKWVFLGHRPCFLDESFKNVANLPLHPIIQFFHIYFETPFNCMHFPVRDNGFNRAKSNIGILEASIRGAVSIVPNWEEWQIPGALKYDNAKQYADHLEAVLKHEVDITGNNKKALSYIKDHYRLEKMNDLRWKYIKQFV